MKGNVVRYLLTRTRLSITAPTITSAAPTAFPYGVAITHVNTATGTPAPTFSITAGAAPTGVTLNADGTWSGTPTASGNFTFTVTATNSAGTADQAATVLVSYASKALSFSPIALYSLIGATNPANDLSGHGYHGTVYSATPAGGAAVPFPEGGNAMLFDGIYNWVDCFSAGLATALDGNAHTMIAWFVPTSWSATGSQASFCVQTDTVGHGLTEIIKPNLANTMTANILGNGSVAQLNKTGLTVVEWDFMAITVNGSNGYAYYDSGTPYDTTATRTAWSDAETIVSIGGRGASLWWGGSIAYAAIFPVLSDANIAILATP